MGNGYSTLGLQTSKICLLFYNSYRCQRKQGKTLARDEGLHTRYFGGDFVASPVSPNNWEAFIQEDFNELIESFTAFIQEDDIW